MQLLHRTLNLAYTHTLQDLLAQLRTCFEYAPGLTGSNLDACIDILSSLRIPQDGMTRFHLAKNEAVMLTIRRLYETTHEVKNSLLTIITEVNNRSCEMGDTPLIYLLLQDLDSPHSTENNCPSQVPAT